MIPITEDELEVRARFTPGPWCHEGRGPNMTVLFAGEPSPQARLSPCLIMDGKLEEREANAHLIAAAPTMYTLLEEIAPLMAMMMGPIDDIPKKIMAALRKARGETP